MRTLCMRDNQDKGQTKDGSWPELFDELYIEYSFWPDVRYGELY